MKPSSKLSIFSCVSIIASMLVAGCGKTPASTGTDSTQQIDNTPVTLTLASQYPWDDALSQSILQKLHEKYPNVTLNIVVENKGSTLQDLITNNTPPDVLYSNDSQITTQWEQLGLATDLTPYIQKYKEDLNRYIPSWISYLHNVSDSGTLYALPWITYYDVIYYNKDLFDKLGVPYPKDGLTWPQFLDLVKRTTRNVGGVQYRGFTTNGFQVPPSQFPLLTVDPATDKANVDTDKWTEVLQFYKDLYSIPGNLPQDTSHLTGTNAQADFNNGTLAMLEIGSGGLPTAPPNLNYDSIILPTWPDAPNQTQAISGRLFGLSSSSQHKDMAFKVIQYLTSDEIEDILIRNGNVPSIQSPSLLQEYNKDNPFSKGRNINAVIYGLNHYKAAVLPAKVSKYESIGSNQMMKTTIPNVAAGKLDINTALKQTTDSINKAIDTAKQQQ